MTSIQQNLPEEQGPDLVRADVETHESLDDLSVALYEVMRERVRDFSRGRNAVDPTDLVHDAYLRLARSDKYGRMERSEFLALTATVVRRLLIDEARRNQSRKDYTAQVELTISDAGKITAVDELDFLALDEAMQRLNQVDPIQSRIVELRFFAGLSGDEVGKLMGLDRRQVSSEWSMARAWLKRELER